MGALSFASNKYDNIKISKFHNYKKPLFPTTSDRKKRAEYIHAKLMTFSKENVLAKNFYFTIPFSKYSTRFMRTF